MTIWRRYPFALIFLLALLLRVGYLIEIHDTPIWRWHTWEQTDMHTFLRVAQEIQEQGMLVPSPHHPYHITHAQTGTPEQWERWLGGPHALYRVPGYYYFLALILGLSGGSLLAVKLVHAVLGAAHALLLGLIGARMMGRRAGVITGLLAAAYGPFVAIEAMILREGPGLFLAAAALYQILHALESTAEPGRPWRRQWLGAGMLLGLGGLLKEPGLVLVGSVWLWAWAQSLRRRDPLPRLVPWLLLCGVLVPFVPLVVRNVLVGAPPLGSSTIFAWNFAIANAVDNSSGGTVLEIPRSVAGVMAGSEGRLPEVIRLTWQNYEGAPTQLFVNWWARFSTIWSNVEIPDNASYAFLVLHSALLSVLPRFVCIWLPAALALGLLGWRWTRRRVGRLPAAVASGSEHTIPWLGFAPRTLSLILVCLALNIPPLSLTYISSRYRMTLVPFLILLAGWMLAQATIWIQQRERRRLAGLSAGLVLLSMVWWLWPARPVVQALAIRWTDFAIAAADLVSQRDLAGARRELQEGLRYCGQLPAGPEGLRAECTQPLVRVWKDFFGEASR